MIQLICRVFNHRIIGCHGNTTFESALLLLAAWGLLRRPQWYDWMRGGKSIMRSLWTNTARAKTRDPPHWRSIPCMLMQAELHINKWRNPNHTPPLSSSSWLCPSGEAADGMRAALLPLSGTRAGNSMMEQADKRGRGGGAWASLSSDANCLVNVWGRGGEGLLEILFEKTSLGGSEYLLVLRAVWSGRERGVLWLINQDLSSCGLISIPSLTRYIICTRSHTGDAASPQSAVIEPPQQFWEDSTQGAPVLPALNGEARLTNAHARLTEGGYP